MKVVGFLGFVSSILTIVMFILYVPNINTDYNKLLSHLNDENLNIIKIKSIEPSTTRKSMLSEGKMINYRISNVVDDNSATAWCEGESSYGIGEFIEFNFKEEVDISKIKILNGYGKSDELFIKNSRVKKLLVTDDEDNSIEVTLIDDMNLNVYDLDMNGVSNLKLEIVEVYEGTKFSDTLISEISFE